MADVEYELLMEPFVFEAFENMLRETGLIQRHENFGRWYQKSYALAFQMLDMCSGQLDRYKRTHPDVAGNRLIQYAHTLGRPLAKLSDIVTRVTRMGSGRLVVIHTANPAVHDKRLRHLAELVPMVFTPMLRDVDEITRRRLPSQVHFGPFIGWTAPGTPGFYDMLKTPAEFQSTRFAIPDMVTDGRLTESSIPHHLGSDIIRAALDHAPEEQSLDSFPSLP